MTPTNAAELEPWTPEEIESGASTAGKRKPEPKIIVARRQARLRERQAEQLAAVNAKLLPLGMDWKQLMQAIINGTVEVVPKEKK